MNADNDPDEVSVSNDDIEGETELDDIEPEAEAEAERDEEDISDEEGEDSIRIVSDYEIVKNIITDPKYKLCSDKLTQFELVELINTRASQIANGEPIFVNTDGLSDAIEMAKKELMMKKSPLIVERRVGYTIDHANKKKIIHVEFWNPNEMIPPETWNII